MEPMIYGYADMQRAALKKARCKNIVTEKKTGETTARPALQRLLKKLNPGDTLIVWKLDRLGRSLRDLISMLDDLKQRGIKFRSLTEAIDTATPTGRAMWQMIGLLTDARSRDQLKKGLLAGFHAGIT